MTKYIFVTGGVVSSLGKGIAAASLAAILETRGLKISMLKLDPETRHIPIVTYTGGELPSADEEDDEDQTADDDFPSVTRQPMTMN